MLTTVQKQQLEEAMKGEESSLRRLIDSLEETIQSVDADYGLGRDPDADPMGVLATNEMALATARRRLALLIEQMKRVENEDYGLCAECGAEIPFERLMAAPETELCVKCARRHDAFG